MESKEHLEQSISFGQKVLELAPDNAQAHLALGGACFKKGEYDESIKFLEKALELNPEPNDLDRIYLYLGQAYFAHDLIDKAISCFENITRQKSESPAAYFLMATCYHKKGDYDTAIADYQKVVSLNSRYDHVHSALGTAYASFEQYPKAIEAFQKNMAVNGKNSYDLYAIGASCLALNIYDQALDYLAESLSFPVETTERSQSVHNAKEYFLPAIVYYARALFHGDEKRLKQYRRTADWLIIDLCKQIITKRINKRVAFRSLQSLPYYLISIAYQGQDDYDKAIETCQTIHESDPEDSLASFLLGELYIAQAASPQAAIAAYKQALAQDSQDVETATKLVSLYLDEAQYDLALAYSQKALAINPDNPLANFQAGLTYWKKGLPYAAQPILEKAVEMDPANLEAFFYLGEVYSAMNNQTEARRVWQKVVDSDTEGKLGPQAKAKLEELEKT